MKRYAIACVALLMCGCTSLPGSRQHSRSFEIENLQSGFAFKGRIIGKYYLECDHIRVDVADWQIRFGCGDQEGRQLDSVYFALFTDWGDDRFTHCVYGKQIVVDQYIHRSQDIWLNNLSFTIPLEGVATPERTWLVAVYERVEDGVPGRSYAHNTYYLFSREETKFYKAKMRR